MDLSVQGIVFDKDGVLFDFRATWESWAEQFLLRAADNDRPLARKLGNAIGFDLDAREFNPDSLVIAGTLGEIADALSSFLPDESNVLSQLTEEALEAPQVETVPLVPLMKALRARGLKLGVATNDGIEPALAHLESVGAADCFDFVAGYDSGFGGKPAPGQLLAFCTELDVAPERCLMVGDSLHDMLAGKAAGMTTLGVLTGMAQASDLAPYAYSVLRDIGHIPAWLDANTS